MLLRSGTWKLHWLLSILSPTCYILILFPSPSVSFMFILGRAKLCLNSTYNCFLVVPLMQVLDREIDLISRLQFIGLLLLVLQLSNFVSHKKKAVVYFNIP